MILESFVATFTSWVFEKQISNSNLTDRWIVIKFQTKFYKRTTPYIHYYHHFGNVRCARNFSVTAQLIIMTLLDLILIVIDVIDLVDEVIPVLTILTFYLFSEGLLGHVFKTPPKLLKILHYENFRFV